MILTTYDRGMLEGMRAMVIRLASRQCGSPDEATRMKIHAIEDFERLEQLRDAAAMAQSWEELLAPK